MSDTSPPPTAPSPAPAAPMVAAHDQRVTLHIVEHYPAHEPREDDPHYRLFNALRRRLAAAGKLVCRVGNADCRGSIELHHNVVEFALLNGVDIPKLAAYTGAAIATEEDLLVWAESEANLWPLCTEHHRGRHGVHCEPYPVWLAQMFWRLSQAPAECVPAGDDPAAA